MVSAERGGCRVTSLLRGGKPMSGQTKTGYEDPPSYCAPRSTLYPALSRRGSTVG